MLLAPSRTQLWGRWSRRGRAGEEQSGLANSQSLGSAWEDNTSLYFEVKALCLYIPFGAPLDQDPVSQLNGDLPESLVLFLLSEP